MCATYYTFPYDYFQIVSEYKSARSELEKCLSAGDLRLLDEIHEFLSTPDCSWGLSRQHLNALGKSIILLSKSHHINEVTLSI